MIKCNGNKDEQKETIIKDKYIKVKKVLCCSLEATFAPKQRTH